MNQSSALILLFALFVASQASVGVAESHPSDHSRGARKFVASVHGRHDEYGAEKGGRKATCDRYPRVCHAKGSPGRDCCRKKCVDVRSDRLNCGMCGNKCRYQETCCKGRCVNPLHDRKNCGGCGKRCSRGNVCDYGMCNYA